MLNEAIAPVNTGFNADGSPRENNMPVMRRPWQEKEAQEQAAARAQAMERWERLKNRLADEISRGYSIARLANETRLQAEQIDAWTKDFDFARQARYFDRESGAEKIEAALEARFKELDQERAEEGNRTPERIETSVIREVIEGITMARDEGEIVDISAPPGSGKSQGVSEYMAKARKAEGFDCPVWLIELSEFALTTKAVLGMIAHACGAACHDYRDEHSMFEAIADKTLGKGGVLIVEEAQHLGDAKNINGIRIFNGLRRFVDKGCFGIVFIGNGELYRRLKNGQHAQLLSRMSSFRKEIHGVTEEDVDKVMAAWGVNGKEERALCLKIAKSPGALRSLVNVFRRSLRDYGRISLATLNKVPKG